MQAARSPDGHDARVLHIAQRIAGGVASFLEEVAEFQSARFGAENVRFLIPRGSEGQIKSADASQLITFDSSSRTPAALLEFGQTATKVIREFKPDILHLHSSFAGAIVRLALLPRKARPKIVYCPHGWGFGMETGPLKKRAYAALEQLLALRTDAILVNSVDEYRLAMQFGLPPGKTETIKNGIASAPLPPAVARRGPVRLAFIGRPGRQKGLDLLLDTLRRYTLPNIRFDIVGASRSSGGAVDEALALNNVTFHGWLSRSETLTLLNQADALVMPSRWDAAPIVAIEAMRSGLPVIASNRGGLPEIVGHRVGGLIFDINDADALGTLLLTLRREELRLLGTGARKRWETEYRAEPMNERTCEAYDRVLSLAYQARTSRGSERVSDGGLVQGQQWA